MVLGRIKVRLDLEGSLLLHIVAHWLSVSACCWARVRSLVLAVGLLLLWRLWLRLLSWKIEHHNLSKAAPTPTAEHLVGFSDAYAWALLVSAADLRNYWVRRFRSYSCDRWSHEVIDCNGDVCLWIYILVAILLADTLNQLGVLLIDAILVTCFYSVLIHPEQVFLTITLDGFWWAIAVIFDAFRAAL